MRFKCTVSLVIENNGETDHGRAQLATNGEVLGGLDTSHTYCIPGRHKIGEVFGDDYSNPSRIVQPIPFLTISH
ncbi:hypothetical protein KIN20_023425 [Parelaphostrongylus tenuis]|uniref:Uncharacterized protein n=1 Tax=Parelaphostrongylus tenuis TaxID=148309 RepID=A0AAD5QSY7_PARTN|nr:hypothetical protein KIN20_023425 [Parelaphostrongylus tenuis]